jgi:phosphoribosylaminoimidazole-succinocarboxamide synthase
MRQMGFNSPIGLAASTEICTGNVSAAPAHNKDASNGSKQAGQRAKQFLGFMRQLYLRTFIEQPKFRADIRGLLALNLAVVSLLFPAMNEPILSLDLPGIKKVRSGKVREVFDLGDRFLLVASDRISAFDVIMPNGIPHKGAVLTQISHFWFEKFASLVPNHLLAKASDPLPANLQPFADKLAKRSMIVKKAKPLAIECIVRGYLSGSGLKEYKKSQTVCGIKLPAGLVDSSELPEPIFTPSTKAEQGHDENINFEQACDIVGKDLATQARDLSLMIYKAGRDYARQRGIIIADTKFEFGLFDGKLILIDEVLTPDSSRFWPADQYVPGKGQPSFDKQFVRDYLETLAWDKTPPGPQLPEDVVAKTSAKYLEAYERLTGKKL